MKDKYNKKIKEIEERLAIVETALLKLVGMLNERETKIAEFLATLSKGGEG